ncbi:MAG: YbaK/EbsC family protein [Candidatus Bathyarchaeia archaeon]
MRGRERVSAFLDRNFIDTRKVVLDKSTGTSRMAAEALGCEVKEIAKSIVFTNGSAHVVVIFGDKRVDTRKLARYVGHEVRIAEADIVRERTGYVIGGVPPFPHWENVRVILDESLRRFDEYGLLLEPQVQL